MHGILVYHLGQSVSFVFFVFLINFNFLFTKKHNTNKKAKLKYI